MNNEEILEGNKLIAEFMGARIEVKNSRIYVYGWRDNNTFLSSTPITWCDTEAETLVHVMKGVLNPNYGAWGRFYSSWDWLMPVVEKIESMKFYLAIKSSPTISGRWYMHSFIVEHDTVMGRSLIKIDSDYSNSESKIQTVFRGVIEFIKWYNDHK